MGQLIVLRDYFKGTHCFIDINFPVSNLASVLAFFCQYFDGEQHRFTCCMYFMQELNWFKTRAFLLTFKKLLKNSLTQSLKSSKIC